jgi:hypothetical protein
MSHDNSHVITPAGKSEQKEKLPTHLIGWLNYSLVADWQ